ncbi:uncharacterized protein VTP21DRAFT_8388 [Calcarisporiella thermophila]|uniref:uncharacterized protein n=1 Tax=Calcarisporiella thermophila TaxID=911321 RepID=UPI003743A431
MQDILDQKVASSSKDQLPEETCSICLQIYQDKSLLNSCFHAFCFACILQWIEYARRARCPLCVQPFEYILHDVKSELDYKKYWVPEFKTESELRQPIDRSRRPNQYRRFQRRWQEPIEERQLSKTQQEAVERRRYIYRHKLFAMHIGSNRYSKYREVSPTYFSSHPEAIRRLVPWIRRDLQAILEEENAEIVREYVIAVLKTHDLRTESALELLRPFLEPYTEHFVHELVAFARSPLEIRAYDITVQYNEPIEIIRSESLPRSRSSSISSSSSSSSLGSNISSSSRSEPKSDTSTKSGSRPKLQTNLRSDLILNSSNISNSSASSSSSSRPMEGVKDGLSSEGDECDANRLLQDLAANTIPSTFEERLPLASTSSIHSNSKYSFQNCTLEEARETNSTTNVERLERYLSNDEQPIRVNPSSINTALNAKRRRVETGILQRELTKINKTLRQ